MKTLTNDKDCKLGSGQKSTKLGILVLVQKVQIEHYQPDIILLTVRWYLWYNLSYRNLVEMMEERGLSIAHTTIIHWVHQYGPELDERVGRHLKPTNDS